MKACDGLWGYYTADQWLAESTGLHKTQWDYLFSLRNGFTAYFVLSRSTAFLPPSPPRSFASLGGDGGKKAVHRGDHDISRKAIAQGK